MLLSLYVPSHRIYVCCRTGSGFPELKAYLQGVKMENAFSPFTCMGKLVFLPIILSSALPLGREVRILSPPPSLSLSPSLLLCHPASAIDGGGVTVFYLGSTSLPSSLCDRWGPGHSVLPRVDLSAIRPL